jgi:hypothetical protein
MLTNSRLKWESGKKLPKIRKEIYDAMYRISIINGEDRLFAYVEFPSGLRYYLVEISEE